MPDHTWKTEDERVDTPRAKRDGPGTPGPTDGAKRQRLFEDLFRSIAEGVSADTGSGFFRSLVLHLGRCPGIDHAFIGELSGGDARSIQTIAMCSHGRIVGNVVYALDGTPCDNVLDTDTCIYPRDVSKQFPTDTLLAGMNLQGYAGTPLRDSSGTVLGVMVMLSEREMSDPGLTRSILQIFAARASAELERKRMEDRIARRSRIEKTMATVSQTFISGDIVNIPAMLATLGDAIGADRAFVFTTEHERNELWQSFVWTRDAATLPVSVFESADMDAVARRLDATPNDEHIVVDATAQDGEDTPPILPVAAGDSILMVPVRSSANTLIGILGMNAVGRYHRWPAGDIQPLRVAAGMLSTHWERRRALARLEGSEARYHRLFQEDVTANVIVKADGTILDCNLAFTRIFGFASPRAARGTNVQRLCSSPEARKEFWEKLRVRRRLSGHEVQLTRLGGEPVNVIGNIYAVLDKHGRIEQIVGHFFDITARKSLEEQLRQSQKMEAIGRLAGGVAHDFNNLLTAISGYSQLTLMKLPEGHPARADTEEVIKAGERASSLTRQLLDFSRKRPLTPKLIGVNDLVLDMEKMLRRLIGEDIELVTTLDPDVGPIKADPGGIEQVIMNLAINARDAMPAGGKLAIETAAVDMDIDSARRHIGVKPGRHVRITVRDTGTGMAEDVQSNIFEPFFSTKEHGTGLGLTMVYGIIKQSGGHIRVSTVKNRGTTFHIHLPQAQGKVESVQLQNRADVDHTGTETILLVEDEDLVRRYTRRVLSQRGYNVLEACYGGEALQVCRSHAGPIHLMLTDVVMPKMNGRVLAEKMKSLCPNIRVMFMSGYDGESIDSVKTNPHTAFVQKPFTPNALAEHVRRVLDDAPRTSP